MGESLSIEPYHKFFIQCLLYIVGYNDSIPNNLRLVRGYKYIFFPLFFKLHMILIVNLKKLGENFSNGL